MNVACVRHAERTIGPVRAVAFHPSRALLVTGGDDYKIKVWGELLPCVAQTATYFP